MTHCETIHASKSLSLVLRHHPEAAALTHDSAGVPWAHCSSAGPFYRSTNGVRFVDAVPAELTAFPKSTPVL